MYAKRGERSLWDRLSHWPSAWFAKWFGGGAAPAGENGGGTEKDGRIAIDARERRLLLARLRRAEAAEASDAALDAASQALVDRIRAATAERNRNNVTRTKAYREFYERRPEVHWAFLAHMVSRNGGWSMTDLEGELLPRLLDAGMRRRLFDMLEDANSLIFGDAYPQLLLYEESRRTGRALFSLLPAFGVSRFMRPVWERFWETGDSALLTIALIVNEQHYIEGRVVQRPDVAEHVLASLPFQAQSALQLNQVVFPFGGRNAAGRQRLAGLVVEDFGNLKERIEVGKRLYATLFALPDVARGAEAFAASTPHTGSRADYWPELFAAVRDAPAGAPYRPRLEGETLLPGAPRLYSPRLAAAWKNRPLREPERYDWLRDVDEACAYLSDARAGHPYEMSAEACYGLNKVELAVVAKSALG